MKNILPLENFGKGHGFQVKLKYVMESRSKERVCGTLFFSSEILYRAPIMITNLLQGVLRSKINTESSRDQF